MKSASDEKDLEDFRDVSEATLCNVDFGSSHFRLSRFIPRLFPMPLSSTLRTRCVRMASTSSSLLW
jgi:hypothetical protein